MSKFGRLVESFFTEPLIKWLRIFAKCCFCLLVVELSALRECLERRPPVQFIFKRNTNIMGCLESLERDINMMLLEESYVTR
jgi:hypothetical protein